MAKNVFDRKNIGGEFAPLHPPSYVYGYNTKI